MKREAPNEIRFTRYAIQKKVMAQTTLSQDEIDALRETMKNGDGLKDNGHVEKTPSQIKVVSYNFRQPQVISGDQAHAIRVIHEAFGNTLQSSLFTTLKRTVEVKLVAVNQITYGEFVLSISNPTYIAVLGTKPDIGNVELELNLTIATSIIDTLLGGDGNASFEDRALTILERNILSETINLLLAALKTAWSNMSDLTFTVTEQESNPEYIQLTRPENLCMGITFDIHIGEITGVLNLCYPVVTIESVLATSEERSGLLSKGQVSKGDNMMTAIGAVPLEFRAVIGPITISAQQLGLLKQGDIICIDKRLSSPVDIFIDKRLSYIAELGQHQGKIAFSLINQCSTDGHKKEVNNG